MVDNEKSVTTTEDDTLIPERETENATFSPQVDIVEKEDSIQIVADMPGVTKDDVEIVLEEGVLTIAGQADDTQYNDMELQRQEYEVGDFYRRFAVGEGLDLSEEANIDAAMDDGVLQLTIPKSEQFQPRKIEIQ